MENASLFFETMKVWVLSDGKMGHLNQSLGVAESLVVDSAQIKVVHLKKRRFGGLLSLLWPPLKVEKLPQAPWPDVVIATGSLTVPVAKWLKMQNPSTVTVQMMAPLNRFGVKVTPGGFLDHVLNSENLNFFDVIASPVHEGFEGSENRVVTLGAPNRIKNLALAEAQQKWQDTFKHLKKRKVAVLVGGNSKRFNFEGQEVAKFVADLEKLAQEKDVSLLITTSRRTGPKAKALIEQKFKGGDHFVWDGKGDNPYIGLLACADAVVATPDSVSMVSEAASTGKPVYIWGVGEKMYLPKMGKFNHFYQALHVNGFVKPFAKVFDRDENWQQKAQPLDDTGKVAGFVRAQILKRLNNT
ncbi:MAG: hypothetical protein CMF60_08280 [Magnetococcales bacterium]|nr:hypothetical protein [Magnetococcales bacterium]|tara:strand:- start:2636 stop:3703 length:1068 start_codon:yes stop_codon:yes gene_type:complete